LARGVVAFFGDFLGFQENTEIMDFVKASGDTRIVFSDNVQKVNKRLKIQERVLVMTDRALYNFEKFKKPKKGMNYGFKRRIDLRSVAGISVSKLSDNFFVVHVPSEYDYVYETVNKTVFITLLNKEYKDLLGRACEVKVVESIAYKLKSAKENAISFKKDEAVMQADVKKVKGKLQIAVPSGIKQ